MQNNLLHVIGVYSNPRRYKARSRLLREWISNSLDSGVHLTVVEHAFGERPYEIGKDEFKHLNLLQIRGGPEHELWLKEGLINYGIAHLPENAKYVCWEDTDIAHERGDWASETVHMLQHYRVGQTWTHSYDKGPNGNVVRNEWGNDVDRSFSAAWLAGDIKDDPGEYQGANVPKQSRALLENKGEIDYRQHYGFSWAMRRKCFTGIGRLIDWMVTGSADFHMAMCFAHRLVNFDDRMAPSYNRKLHEFQDRCEIHIKQDIGCVDGTVVHGWHGAKRHRFYLSRFDILRESGFDPDRDIAYDVHGLPTLISDNRILRDGLRRYNMQRNEDSIDV